MSINIIIPEKKVGVPQRRKKWVFPSVRRHVFVQNGMNHSYRLEAEGVTALNFLDLRRPLKLYK
jgi:hypothetical protein